MVGDARADASAMKAGSVQHARASGSRAADEEYAAAAASLVAAYAPNATVPTERPGTTASAVRPYSIFDLCFVLIAQKTKLNKQKGA